MRMVVKVAGALLDDAAALETLARQVAQLAHQGHEILVVHGGGKIFTATLKRMGIESRFVGGLRVTDRETRDVAVMVLGGLLNKRLAGAISAAGQPAVGICASDSRCFLAEPMMHDEVAGALGFVGYLTGANLEFIESFWKAGIVPVASCLGLGADGELYNINADHMAAACAEYIHADRLIYLTDVAGVLDGTKVLKVVSTGDAEDLIRQNKVSGGMILKLEACKRALSAGVAEVRIVGGSVPKGLLAAANGARFPGTRVTPEFPASAAGLRWERGEIERARNRRRATASAGSRAEVRSARRLAPFDEHLQALRHDFHAWARLLRVRSRREEISGFSGRALPSTRWDIPIRTWCERSGARRGAQVHVSNLFHNPFQGPLAAKLAKWSRMDRAFFTNSGTEAVEGALKLARVAAKQKPGGRDKTRFLALEHSFHGRTFGALSITHELKYREPFEPLVPGVEFVRFNDVADLEAKFTADVCAIVIEPIQGEGGIYPVSDTFWKRARELATQHGAALIADEIQCGLGRTGRAFAYQRLTGLPDMVVVAKPLAGGLPLGAFLAREEFAAAFSPGMHGSTFGGGPLTCATGLTSSTRSSGSTCSPMCARVARSCARA